MSASSAYAHALTADRAIEAAVERLVAAFMRGDTELARGFALTVAQWRDEKLTDAEDMAQLEAWEQMARTSPSAAAQWA